MAEQLIRNEQVVSSILTTSSIKKSPGTDRFGIFCFQFSFANQPCAQMIFNISVVKFGIV